MVYGLNILGIFASLLIEPWLTNNTLHSKIDVTSQATNSAEKPYVLKCCPWNYTILENKSCIKPEGPVEFLVPKQEKANGTVGEYDSNHFDIKIGIPKVVNAILFPRDYNYTDEFGINNEGGLLDNKGIVISQPEQFCLEIFESSGFIVFLFYPSDEKPEEAFITILLFVSLLFLICTFCVYAFIKDLRNMHGKSLMYHVASLSMAFIGLIITSYTRSSEDILLCFIRVFIVQFFFLVSFFWLNVMSFDLWWTFSGFRSFEEVDNKQTSKTFIIYSLYSWGNPTLIIIITYCMQFESLKIPFMPNPGLCDNNNWFVDKLSSWFYFYGPIAIILFFNFLMFVHTAFIIFRQMKNRLKCKNSESKINSKQDIWRFVLYLKLFIIMGINWMAEILMTYFDDEFKYDYPLLKYIFDAINASQGVMIFLIVVCKKRVIKMVNEKLGLEFTFFKTSTASSTRTQNDI